MRPLALFLSLVLAACQTTGPASNTFIGKERADSTYRRVDARFRDSLHGPFVVPIYYKLFDRGGRLAACGWYANDGMTQTQSDAVADFFRTATVTIAGRPISAAYLEASAPRHNEFDGTANCVVTNEPWSPSFAQDPRITISGPSAHRRG